MCATFMKLRKMYSTFRTLVYHNHTLYEVVIYAIHVENTELTVNSFYKAK